MTGQGRHPKKEVEEALRYCEKKGWEAKKTVAGHKWGVVRCGEGCKVFVWSTPKNPGNHAKAIRRAPDKCPHREAEEENRDV